MTERIDNKIQGILTPLLTPLDERGAVHEQELRRLIRWLIEKGSHGLYPNGSTGEATRLTAEERRRVVQITIEEAAGRVPVIAGTAEANVRETLEACEFYAELGARAVAVMPPVYYRVADESALAYFEEIARNSPIDIVLYNVPAFTTPISLGTVQKLAELPRVIGIKDSSGDLLAMMRMISSIRPCRPDFSFLTGWDPVLVPMLLIGCDGGAQATANVIPEYMKQMFDLVRQGQVEEAIRMQYGLLPLLDAMLQRFEFPDGFRAAAEVRGFSFGPPRQPATRTQLQRRHEHKRYIESLLSKLGLVEGESKVKDPATIQRLTKS